MVDVRTIDVIVMFSPGPREVREWAVALVAPCTVLQAVQASGLSVEFPAFDLHGAMVGVWGRKARLSQLLREGDRVEVYRPLLVDPKVARRERFRTQGARGAGLFANRREGSKPGY